MWALAKKELNRRFNLLEDKATNEEIIESIESAVDFRGANLWILVFAIVLASIGLDINSAAVIIGAMLISPLMGPIVGLGLAIAIVDFDLIKRSVKSLAFATTSSVVASTLYFILSPFSVESSELLARTNPTVWDVLIAFCGGLAGIIAYTRKSKTNTIPGVAIATALMPPLCTLGFGLAHMNFKYIFGAAYLFFINSVFICFATFLICKFIRIPQREYLESVSKQKFQRAIAAIVIITIIPSLYLTYRIVNQSITEKNLTRFIEAEIKTRDCQVIDRRINWDTQPQQIILSVVGSPLNDQTVENLNKRLATYSLSRQTLILKQALSTYQQPHDLTAIKSAVLKDFYEQSTASIKSKDEKIAALEAALSEQKMVELPTQEIFRELRAYQPEVVSASFAKAKILSLNQQESEETLLANIDFSTMPSANTLNRIESWLITRTNVQKVILKANRAKRPK